MKEWLVIAAMGFATLAVMVVGAAVLLKVFPP